MQLILEIFKKKLIEKTLKCDFSVSNFIDKYSAIVIWNYIKSKSFNYVNSYTGFINPDNYPTYYFYDNFLNRESASFLKEEEIHNNFFNIF